jgi:DNA-binding transcriptional LysR family regulator
MDLRTLKYFQAVAEELSFSKAARKLRIAQPALSRAVKDLETELGGVLLKRNRRNVLLTAPGAVLLRETSALLAQAEEMTQKVRRHLRGQEGELRLGFIGPPTQSFLASVLSEYRQRYPQVSIVLEERTPERVWEMVTRDRLDLGLTRPVVAGERIGLKTRLIQKEPLCAVLDAQHPLTKVKKLTWRHLRDEPLILLSRREGVGLYEAIVQACRLEGFAPKIAHTPSVVGTVLTYVEAGMGVGVASQTVDTLNLKGKTVFRPLSPLRHVELVMVWSATADNPAAAAFRELLVDRLE